MPKQYVVLWIFFVVLFTLSLPCEASRSRSAASSSNAGRHLFGGGANYLRTVGDIRDDDDWDNDAISYFGSYQYREGTSIFEFDVEYIPNVGPDNEAIWQPQVYLMGGRELYAGLGFGWPYYDGSWADDPFYAVRIGFDIPIGSKLFFDINTNYRFQRFSEIDSIGSSDANQLTFGAALRFAL